MQVWGQLQRAQIEPLASDPSTTALVGRIWFNTSTNLLKFMDNAATVQTLIYGGIGLIVNADVNASAAIAGTKISPNFGSQNIVTTGSVTGAGFIATGSTIVSNGIYLPNTNSIGFSTNSTNQGSISSTGGWSFGSTSSGSSTIHSFYVGNAASAGTSLRIEVVPTDSGGVAAIGRSVNDGVMALVSDVNAPAVNNGAGIYVYGSTHATKANVTEFYNAGALSGSISAAGVLTFGVALITSRAAIGGTSNSIAVLSVNPSTTPVTTGASQYGILLDYRVDSTCTSNAFGVESSIRTQAAAFSLGNVFGFNSDTLTLGAGSSVSNFTNFRARVNTNATNNCAFSDNDTIPSGNSFIYQAGSLPSTTAGSWTAASFIPTSSTVPVNGIYLSAANTVGFSTNTTLAGSINASQVWSIGTSTGQQTINGGLVIKNVKNAVQAVIVNGTSTYTGANLYGFSVTNTSNSNNTAIYGVYVAPTTAASTAVTLLTGFEADGFTLGASGSVTNYVDFHASGNHRNGTNNAVFTNTTTFTGNYFLYQSGTDASVLGGRLYITPGTSVLTGTSGAKVGGSLNFQTGPVGTVTTAETTLFTTTISANTMNNTLEGIEIRCSGSFAANANSKTVNIYYGTGTSVLVGAVINNASWYFYGHLYRISSTQVKLTGVFFYGNSSSVTGESVFTVAPTSDQTLKFTGQGVATNDIVGQAFRVSYEAY